MTSSWLYRFGGNCTATAATDGCRLGVGVFAPSRNALPPMMCSMWGLRCRRPVGSMCCSPHRPNSPASVGVMRIVVTGATGYVGSRLVTELLANQHQVMAATRNPERLKRLGWFDDVAPLRLDASDPVSVRAAFAGSEDAAGPIDVVYYLVHGIGQPGFRDADKVAATNVAVAARDAGVRRIVYLGGFVPADEALSEHLTSRAEVAEA